MNLFYLSLIVTFGALVIGSIWYGLIFKKYFFAQKTPYLFDLPINYNLWLSSAFSLFIVGLVYSTLGSLLFLFRAAPKELYYLLGLLLWLCIAAVQLYQAIQIKQPYMITFIHFGFWLIIFIFYAIIFSNIGINF